LFPLCNFIITKNDFITRFKLNRTKSISKGVVQLEKRTIIYRQVVFLFILVFYKVMFSSYMFKIIIMKMFITQFKWKKKWEDKGRWRVEMVWALGKEGNMVQSEWTNAEEWDPRQLICHYRWKQKAAPLPRTCASPTRPFPPLHLLASKSSFIFFTFFFLL